MYTQSLHNHTFRCKHASGTEEEYLQRAVESGIIEFGFSDHTPLPDAYVADRHSVHMVRMEMSQLEDYVKTVRGLAEKYSGTVRVRLGLETEYVPSIWDEYLQTICPYEPEYLILGQHFLRDGAYATLDPTDNPALLKEYVDTVLEAASTGVFCYLAHPDLINFTGDTSLYEDEMRRMLEGLRPYDLPLEINCHGLDGNRNYPNPRFWRLAAEYGSRTVFGLDAHSPDQVFKPALYERARAFAESLDIRLIDRIEI